MGKTVVISSASKGIGASLVHLLAEREAINEFVVNYGHDDAAAQELIGGLPSTVANRTRLVKADLATEEGFEIFAEAAAATANHIDWLVNCTGIGLYKPLRNCSIDEWRAVMDANLTYPIFLVQRLADKLADNAGVLFMSSYAGSVPYSTSLAYGTSKAALSFATRALLKEFEGTQVRVNAVAPGFIETPRQNGRSEESRQRINAKVALHRFGTPEEVASLCHEVLKNTYVNGAVFNIEGGYGYF